MDFSSEYMIFCTQNQRMLSSISGPIIIYKYMKSQAIMNTSEYTISCAPHQKVISAAIGPVHAYMIDCHHYSTIIKTCSIAIHIQYISAIKGSGFCLKYAIFYLKWPNMLFPEFLLSYVSIG